MLYSDEHALAVSRALARNGPPEALIVAYEIIGALPSKAAAASMASLLVHAGCLRQAESLLRSFAALPGHGRELLVGRMELAVAREDWDTVVELGLGLMKASLAAPLRARAMTLLVFALRRNALAHKALELFGALEDGDYDRDLFTQLNHAAHESGERLLALHYGRRVLEDKLGRHPGLSQPRAALADAMAADGRKILSFSLWGDAPLYLVNTLRNAGLARALWDGWTMRVYHGEGVPAFFLDILLRNDVELMDMTGSHLPGTMWRFLVADDPDAAVWLCRDADALLLHRDLEMAGRWLAGPRDFQVIRDHAMHVELMLAGLWGGRRRFAPTMAQLLESWQSVPWDREQDQKFLARVIWPAIRNDALILDSRYAPLDPDAQAMEPPPTTSLHLGATQLLAPGMTMDEVVGTLPLSMTDAEKSALADHLL